MSFTAPSKQTDRQIGQAKVSGLFIYPIKSCRGSRVEQGQLTLKGLAHDREFMLVETASGKFLTQRELPRMALITPRLVDGYLLVDAPGMEPLEIPIPVKGPQREVIVWRDTCPAVDQGELAGKWFSEYLGLDCRLTRLAEDFQRKVSPDYARRATDQVSFADAFPCLLLSEESLVDLNRRLEIPLPMNRFRPNIVIAGSGIPFFEDSLEQVKFGEITFDVVKPCARCAITTTDQATAQVSKEPLRTLASFRRGPSGAVLFGQNIIPHTVGSLSVGDTVEVISYKAS